MLAFHLSNSGCLEATHFFAFTYLSESVSLCPKWCLQETENECYFIYWTVSPSIAYKLWLQESTGTVLLLLKSEMRFCINTFLFICLVFSMTWKCSMASKLQIQDTKTFHKVNTAFQLLVSLCSFLTSPPLTLQPVIYQNCQSGYIHLYLQDLGSLSSTS